MYAIYLLSNAIMERDNSNLDVWLETFKDVSNLYLVAYHISKRLPKSEA